MDREKFDKLDIIDQLEYINQKLKAGLSLNAVCKEIGIDRKSIRRRAKKINYVFDQDQKQYVKIEDAAADPAANITKVIKNITNGEDQENSNKLPNITKVTFKEEEVKNKKILPNITKGNMKEEDQEIKINKKILDELLEMLEWYKTNKKDIAADPAEEFLQGETITKSFKIYMKILDKFEEYCHQHPKLKKQDIVNAAIIEYINNN